MTAAQKPMPRKPQTAAWKLALRAVTALVGGYAAAAGIATLLARLLPIARVEATMWGMVLSFLVFAIVGLWAFHEARLMRVAMVVWGMAAISIGLALLIGVRS